MTLPLVSVDLGKGTQHSDAYRAINPRRVAPTLVLEDGTDQRLAACGYPCIAHVHGTNLAANYDTVKPLILLHLLCVGVIERVGENLPNIASRGGGRLEARKLVARYASPDDKRIKALKLTAAGLVKRAEACVRRAQECILEPPPPDERGKLMELLGRLVDLNNEASRVPLRLVG